jgi:exopolysaccharide biosynthesis polyprenyl glycosylphosphotransferase
MVGVGLIGGPAIGLGGVARLSVLVISLTLISRGVFYEVLRKLRIRGHLLESVVLIGSGPIGTELAEAMDEYPECGLNPVGFVDHAEAEGSSLPYLGDITDLPEIMRRVGARRAMFAFGQAREAEMIPIIRKCPPGSHFYVLLRFFELGVDNAPPALRADIGGFPVMQIRPPAPGNPLLLAKRVFDVAASAIALVFLAPVMAGCALAVHRSGPGPILFRQVRVGLDGRPFEILKFRTMHENDDSDVTWSVETDSRVTTAGRILRATHLDEIPQLFNVLRGEMSLVGPRPERPFFVEQFEDEIHGYRDRHRVRSGITGWSQVNGLVGDSSIEERARRDNWYIEHWSLWSDILIILRTIPTMSRRNR